MRYLGNKTRLVGEIESFMADRGLAGGTLLDLFTGSTAVARHFKTRGWTVLANDWAAYSQVLGKAYIELNAYPRFERLLARPSFRWWLRDRGPGLGKTGPDASPPDSRPLRSVIAWLNERCEAAEGLVARQFSPAGEAGRMYFTEANARRIDGIRNTIERWWRRRLITEGEFHLLLAALIEAVDRVANISGIYGAYLKDFQTSALKPLTLGCPEVQRSRRKHKVYRQDGQDLVAKVKADVVYVDPPYNHRQYAANYHVPEILAELHTVTETGRGPYERLLYGKTGMRPYEDQKSPFCSGKGGVDSPAGRALRELLARTTAPHLIFSYNEEGVLDRESLFAIFQEASKGRFKPARDFLEIPYKRFRSDRSKRAAGQGYAREYKVLAGRGRDEIHEWLFYVPLAG